MRAGYYYITSIIQKEIIAKKSKVLLQSDVAPLAKVFDIGQIIIKEETILNKYNKVICWLKRTKDEMNVKLEYIDDVISYLDKERNNEA